MSGVAKDAADYERRLRAGMRFIAAKDRSAIAREIMGGIQSQVAAQGGSFAAVSQTLDDPAWVGRQMVRVYGVAAPWLALFLLLGAALGWLSSPGTSLSPANTGTAIFSSLAAFGALLLLLFTFMLRGMPKVALFVAGAAAATRVVALGLPQEGVALLDLFSAGELSLYVLATLLLLVIAGVPALAVRLRSGDD